MVWLKLSSRDAVCIPVSNAFRRVARHEIDMLD